MSVVPFKRYEYGEWCAIARQINFMRETAGRDGWSDSDVHALWIAFFSARG